jgi:hypothetical protein
MAGLNIRARPKFSRDRLSSLDSLGMKRLAALILALGVGTAGCAGQSSEQSRRLAELNNKVKQLESERTSFAARLAALEAAQSAPAASPAAQSVQPVSALDRPLLQVIRLEPAAAPAPGPGVAEVAVGSDTAGAPPEHVVLSGTGSEFHVETVTEPSAAASRGGSGL